MIIHSTYLKMDEIAWKPGLINFFDIMLEDEFTEVVYPAEI